jgi:hypothetical protein
MNCYFPYMKMYPQVPKLTTRTNNGKQYSILPAGVTVALPYGQASEFSTHKPQHLLAGCLLCVCVCV